MSENGSSNRPHSPAEINGNPAKIQKTNHFTTKKITIIGLGRLGLCAGLAFEKKGFDILGVDLIQDYCDQINFRTLQVPEPQVTEMLSKCKHLRATTSFEEGVKFSDTIFIFVDTPVGTSGKSYDHSKLGNVLMQLNDKKISNKHIIISCTVLPGYISKIGRFLIRDCINTTLNYNPEFIAQGSIIENFMNPDMVLIGEHSKEAGDCIEAIYKQTCDNQPIFRRMTPESAEITKLSINCFITMKIAFCNMIGDIADNTPNTDKQVILQAVGTDSRIGNKYLKPGYGFGGPCFPRDNRALGEYGKSVGVDPILPEATDRSNQFHLLATVEKFLKQGKSHYVFENVTYKSRCAVPIIEESQKLEVARLIAERGFKVTIKDTPEVIREVQKMYGSIFEYETY